MGEALDKLKGRPRRFALEYVVDYNATHAYIRAGYGESSAPGNSARLKENEGIKAAIEELEAEMLARLDASHMRTVREITYLAFLDPARLLDDNGDLKEMTTLPPEARAAIAGFDVQETWVGDAENGMVVRTKKVRFHSKLKALELLGKRQRLWDEDADKSKSVDVNITDHKPSD